LPKRQLINSIPVDKTIIFIEEPETNLHPDLQKFIPRCLNFFSNLYEFKDTQFLISTRSPFIISAAAKLDNQKVYLIEDGQTLDKKGKSGKISDSDNYYGEQGFEDESINYVAAKMLGAGIEDLISENKRQLIKTNYIIFCEGGSENISVSKSDEEIYSIIFKAGVDNKKCFFVSCGSKKDVMEIYYFQSKMYSKISSTSEIKYIVDNDNGSKYSIESYLYDPTVIQKACPAVDFSQEIAMIDYTKSIKDKIPQKIQSQTTKEALAETIANMRFESKSTNNIYWQLHTCIFGENSF